MAGKKHKVRGLPRRWLTGSMGPVLVILLLVGVLISVGFASNYYNSARSTLRAKAAAGADYFNTYVMTSYREYYRSATIYAAAFDDSDKIELTTVGTLQTEPETLVFRYTEQQEPAPTPARRKYCGRWKAARCRTTSAVTASPGSASWRCPAC